MSVINGLQPKILKIPLSFLGTGSYNTLILNDNPENPASVIVSNGTANKDDFVNVSLGMGGGFMTRFTLNK